MIDSYSTHCLLNSFCSLKFMLILLLSFNKNGNNFGCIGSSFFIRRYSLRNSSNEVLTVFSKRISTFICFELILHKLHCFKFNLFSMWLFSLDLNNTLILVIDNTYFATKISLLSIFKLF